jgi:hypothetical protein
MLKIQSIGLLVIIILGIILIYIGIQYLFNTEIFIDKIIKYQRVEFNSLRYKYLKNKSNFIFHKIEGIGFILGGVISIVLCILKLFKYIN